MDTQDAPGRTSGDESELDVIRVLDLQGLAAHLARIARPVEQADDDDDILEARPIGRCEHDRDKHRRHGKKGIDNAHQHNLDIAAEIARREADKGANGTRHQDCHQGHAERHARAIDDPCEHIAPEEICA